MSLERTPFMSRLLLLSCALIYSPFLTSLSRADLVQITKTSGCAEELTTLGQKLSATLDGEAARQMNSVFATIAGESSDIDVQPFVRGNQAVLVVSEKPNDLQEVSPDAYRLVDSKQETIVILEKRSTERQNLKRKAGQLLILKWSLAFLAMKPLHIASLSPLSYFKNHLHFLSDHFREHLSLFSAEHWMMIAVGAAIGVPIAACYSWMGKKVCQTKNDAATFDRETRNEIAEKTIQKLNTALNENTKSQASIPAPIIVLSDKNTSDALAQFLASKEFKPF